MSDDPAGLPFKEAIDFFRQKINLPTERWPDILHGAHTRAFTVAGATKDSLLSGFREAVDQAISQGTTLETFRQQFDTLVQAHGWDYKGTRGWRTKVIYDTNLRTAYAAGRWQQMTDPDVLRYNPYWEYEHDDSVLHPRPDHLAWNGLVLSAKDPWWKSNYPPNGWGCKCKAKPVSRRELAASGRKGPDEAPPLDMRKALLNTSSGSVAIDVPKGIDPGWGYNVGEAAFGAALDDATMASWRQQGAAAYERLTPGDWQSAARPELVPADPTPTRLAPPSRDRAKLAGAIETAIGAPEQAFPLPDGSPVMVRAETLAEHMPLDRARFVPLLPELLREPFEVWLAFERHRGTGKVFLRKRIIKLLQLDRKRALVLVAQSVGGVLEAWTLIPTDALSAADLRYLNAQRVGKLLWGR